MATGRNGNPASFTAVKARAKPEAPSALRAETRAGQLAPERWGFGAWGRGRAPRPAKCAQSARPGSCRALSLAVEGVVCSGVADGSPDATRTAAGPRRQASSRVVVAFHRLHRHAAQRIDRHQADRVRRADRPRRHALPAHRYRARVRPELGVRAAPLFALRPRAARRRRGPRRSETEVGPAGVRSREPVVAFDAADVRPAKEPEREAVSADAGTEPLSWLKQCATTSCRRTSARRRSELLRTRRSPAANGLRG